MSAFAKFEQFVEGLIERPFARLLGGQLQPVEIAKRLARVMEAEQTLGVDKTFVPNEYHVLLHHKDFAHFASMRLSLERELSDYLLGTARERRFTLLTRPAVYLETSDHVSPGQVQVAARFTEQVPVTPPPPSSESQPAQHTQKLDPREVARTARERGPRGTFVVLSGAMAGARISLDKSTLTVGRALDNDIVVEDPRVSRYHAELKLKAGHFCIRDLRSSNGTIVNGQYVEESVLHDGDSLTLGDTTLVFQAGDGRS